MITNDFINYFVLVNLIAMSGKLTRSTLSLEISPALQVAYGVHVVVR